MKRTYLRTSECVRIGHPDKVADAISDAILDNYLWNDKSARVAVETMVTTNTVVLAGEVTSTAKINHEHIVRNIVKFIGYDKPELEFCHDTLKVYDFIHTQSEDIAMGVKDDELQGAGDQGVMFGYATDEFESQLPLAQSLARLFTTMLDGDPVKEKYDYIMPDGKLQVTVEYDEDDKPIKISNIVLSVQHRDCFSTTKDMRDAITRMFKNEVLDAVSSFLRNIGTQQNLDIAKLIDDFDLNDLYVNQTGKFIIGGPHGDTGVTGRKIIIDTYGGFALHGGGAFSGKDPSKVDRSASYMARYIANLLVHNKMAKKALVQISYCIGRPDPTSVYVNTYGTAKDGLTDYDITDYVKKYFDLTPKGIEKTLHLREVPYTITAMRGHFGYLNNSSADLANLLAKPYKHAYTWENISKKIYISSKDEITENES